MDSFENTGLEITRVIRNTMLRFCYICHEEDINLVKASCCKNYHHPACFERWMSTLIKSSKKCPMCRRFYKKPHAEAQADDANFMTRIAGLCEEQHPGVNNHCQRLIEKVYRYF
ncbi:uncharacterized protein [Acropora muricata]|uniref:uncharacterized protein n=1 Tax=Acropora muricata TaxID=159855 RepID=UPI0034E4FEED